MFCQNQNTLSLRNKGSAFIKKNRMKNFMLDRLPKKPKCILEHKTKEFISILCHGRIKNFLNGGHQRPIKKGV